MTSLVYMFSFLSGNALPSVNKVEISKLSKKVWIFLQINCNVLFLPLIPKKILLEKFKESFLLFHFRKIFFSWAEKCYGATSFCHRHQKNQENSKKIYPRSDNTQFGMAFFNDNSILPWLWPLFPCNWSINHRKSIYIFLWHFRSSSNIENWMGFGQISSNFQSWYLQM